MYDLVEDRIGNDETTDLPLYSNTFAFIKFATIQPTKSMQQTTRREVLQIHLSKGIDDLGSIRTPLAIYLAIVFVCIYFAIWKGVKSTGKVS